MSTPRHIVQRNRRWVFDYLKSHPCVDCGEDDVMVLQFDHSNPEEKTDRVANLIFRSSIATLQAEMDKCEIRCANCHTKKTAEQFNYYSYLEEED